MVTGCGGWSQVVVDGHRLWWMVTGCGGWSQVMVDGSERNWMELVH